MDGKRGKVCENDQEGAFSSTAMSKACMEYTVIRIQSFFRLRIVHLNLAVVGFVCMILKIVLMSKVLDYDNE